MMADVSDTSYAMDSLGAALSADTDKPEVSGTKSVAACRIIYYCVLVFFDSDTVASCIVTFKSIELNMLVLVVTVISIRQLWAMGGHPPKFATCQTYPPPRNFSPT